MLLLSCLSTRLFSLKGDGIHQLFLHQYNTLLLLLLAGEHLVAKLLLLFLICLSILFGNYDLIFRL